MYQLHRSIHLPVPTHKLATVIVHIEEGAQIVSLAHVAVQRQNKVEDPHFIDVVKLYLGL